MDPKKIIAQLVVLSRHRKFCRDSFSSLFPSSCCGLQFLIVTRFCAFFLNSVATYFDNVAT